MLPLVFNATNPVTGESEIVPVGLLGPVGVGKTQYFKGRSAKDTRSTSVWRPIRSDSFRSASLTATLLRSLASHCHPRMPTATSSSFTKPPLITKIEQTGREYGIILFDELAQAGTDVQEVLADVLDPAERTLAGWAIPDSWIVCFTGNRTNDKSGATRILSLLNRGPVFELGFDVRGWAVWAGENGVHRRYRLRAYADEGFRRLRPD